MKTSSWEIKNSLYGSAVLLVSSNNQLISRHYSFYYYLYCKSAGSPWLTLDVILLTLGICRVRDTDQTHRILNWRGREKEESENKAAKDLKRSILGCVAGSLIADQLLLFGCFLWFIHEKIRDLVPMKPTVWLWQKWKFNPNLTSPGWYSPWKYFMLTEPGSLWGK